METYIQNSAFANIRDCMYEKYLHVSYKRDEEQVNITRFAVFTAGWLRIYISRDVTLCLFVGVIESFR